ncbi:glycosyltransferase [Azoarcus sp. DN11]|uniref:glycosyltransferase n=1 Tax=Azoarcus sp. DN11 TaxID=356837 RepID=UPI000EAB5B4E|nr:glycosyltransferase [Azoarcus sp. DN11]AYH42277.1 hypothetical protein CDA09_02550 [Azoarcus sp. DN11]
MPVMPLSRSEAAAPGPSVSMLVGPLGKGGIGKIVVQLTEALIASGVAVDLLLLGRDSPYFTALPKGANIVMLRSLHPIAGALELARYLRRCKPRVILNHRPRLIRQLRWARSLAGVSFRLVNVIHTHLSTQLRLADKPRRQLRAAQSLAAGDALVATSREVAADAAGLLRLLPEDILIAYPAIAAGDLQMRAKESPAAPCLAQVPESFIVAIGRLEEEKDFPTLIRAFAQLGAARPSLQLVILGEGRARAALESLVAQLHLQGRVHLAGFAANPYAWLARARLLALSSVAEAFGIVLAEALALGVPVVATDCPSGPREILVDGRYGRLVPPGNPAALAEAILATLDASPDPDFLREAVRRFSPEENLRVYRAALGLEDPADGDRSA